LIASSSIMFKLLTKHAEVVGKTFHIRYSFGEVGRKTVIGKVVCPHCLAPPATQVSLINVSRWVLPGACYLTAQAI
jgi:hypothetical protein